jgi:hypothetical protein
MARGRSYRIEDAPIELAQAVRPDREPVPAIAVPCLARPQADPASRPPSDLAIGMDHPGLKTSLERTALSPPQSGAQRPVMTYWVVADDQADTKPAQAPRTAPAVAEELPRPSPPVPHFPLALASGAAIGMMGGAAVMAVASPAGWPAWAAVATGGVLGIVVAWSMERWNVRKS